LEGHSCNAYSPLEATGNEDERRAIFFTERFGSHEQAEAYCRERLRHFDAEATSVSERLWYLSGDQLNLLYDAMKAIADARGFLQYSYVAAWARTTSRDPDALRYTQLQATLENVTERWSTLAFTSELESAYNDQRLQCHFRTMTFLQQSVYLFMNRMRRTFDEARPGDFLKVKN
jgi:hypothetical protein